MKVKPNSLPWTKSARLAFFLSSATIAITGCEEKRTPTSATTPPAPEAPIAAPSPEAPIAAPSPEAPVDAPSSAAPKAAAEDTIHTRVAKEIGEILGKPASAITAEKDLFKDLGADSLDAVEIVMALEEEFDLTIDDAAAEKMSTVADIVKYIRSKQ